MARRVTRGVLKSTIAVGNFNAAECKRISSSSGDATDLRRDRAVGRHGAAVFRCANELSRTVDRSLDRLEDAS